ncbi:hypothetical protein O0I10_006313 [Lichtheimia ornata]|uniref:Uncharacterized protein n=1 Tax=Lichtheimia ornata TaxID=688661 RepID=A0AAD7Y131_9FUNG|nr:uncharacterized protein O0I10_006313 [Lichtheimia ornata]KAJ8658042.1 hypothetical protein O0I10_006313 [Lichtheimia ornata]
MQQHTRPTVCNPLRATKSSDGEHGVDRRELNVPHEHLAGGLFHTTHSNNSNKARIDKHSEQRHTICEQQHMMITTSVPFVRCLEIHVVRYPMKILKTLPAYGY